MTFECLPTYQYRVRETGRRTSTLANLTRGTLNEASTGRFVGYLHAMNHKDIDVLMECKKCGDMPWWDELATIEADGLAECEYCGAVCTPDVYAGQPA